MKTIDSAVFVEKKMIFYLKKREKKMGLKTNPEGGSSLSEQSMKIDRSKSVVLPDNKKAL